MTNRVVAKFMAIASLLLGAAVFGQQPSDIFTVSKENMLMPKGPHIEIIFDHNVGAKNEEKGWLFIEDENNVLMVKIDDKGAVTYGEKYKPDDGAKAFWEAIAREYPALCTALKAKQK